jgi:hypothetical protein
MAVPHFICYYAECHYAEWDWHYTECRGTLLNCQSLLAGTKTLGCND